MPRQIKVSLCINQSDKSQRINLSDMDLSESEWENMSEDEKKEAVQNYVDGCFDQPFWTVDEILID